jgi:hypothetical protein
MCTVNIASTAISTAFAQRTSAQLHTAADHASSRVGRTCVVDLGSKHPTGNSRKSRAPQGAKPALSRAGAKSRVEADRGPATHRASTFQGAARATGGSLMITLLRVRRQSCPCIGAHHWLARSLMSKRCGGNVLRYANGLARSVDLRA